MCLKSCRGSALFEFAVAGIPIMLLIVSVVEISRGMYTYTTLSYAVTEASRLASVHGHDCGVNRNSCAKTVSDIAYLISDSGSVLSADQMNVTMSSALSGTTVSGTTIQCAPLSSCFDQNVIFPIQPGDTTLYDVLVTATYPFQSPLTMFFPGLTSPTAPITTIFSVTSQEPIQF
jgi:Flp pilus assembly protein TadG